MPPCASHRQRSGVRRFSSRARPFVSIRTWEYRESIARETCPAMLRITSSPAPDSENSVTSVCRLSCHRPTTFGFSHTFVHPVLNVVRGDIHFRDRSEHIFSLHVPLNGFRIDSVCRTIQHRAQGVNGIVDVRRESISTGVLRPFSCATAKPVDPTRQTDGHHAARAPPAATWRPSYHLAAPARGWRPCARTGANSGEPTARQHCLVFLGGTRLERCAS